MNKKKLARFILSGGTAAAVEYVSFVILLKILGGVNLLLVAQTISFTLGLIVSFTLNRVWVFEAEGRVHIMFMKYLILAGINLLLSNGIIAAIHIIAPVTIAKLVTMALIATWNYIIFQKVIFR